MVINQAYLDKYQFNIDDIQNINSIYIFYIENWKNDSILQSIKSDRKGNNQYNYNWCSYYPYSTYSTMDKMLRAWLAEAKKLENGEITKEEYDEWRYKYPELDTHQIWAKVYPQELFDFIDDCAKKAEKEEQKETKRKKKK